MFTSRNLEKTQRTKFRKTQSEEKIVEKVKSFPKTTKRETPRGFDMWEDEEVSSDGC